MSQQLAILLKSLTAAELSAFASYEHGRANDHQRIAAKAQREADAARKELKRRAREAKS